MKPTMIYFVTGAFVVAIAAACIWYLWNRPDNSSTDIIFQNILLAVASLGALLSAMYAFWSSNLAWLAYQAANQPSALFQVVTKVDNGIHKTVVHYKNLSIHDMQGMEISMRALFDSSEYDLSDLFPRRIGLPAGDSRRRMFDTNAELTKRGLSPSALSTQNSGPVRLSIGYSHLHGGRRVNIANHQSYVWNPQGSSWDIG
jgi:hypothetical protein